MTRHLFSMLALLVLSGCTTFSASGPSDVAITTSASAKLTTSGRGTNLQYALVDITPQVIGQIPDYTVGSLNQTLGMGKGGPGTVTIGVGDQVAVTVFEASDGGLFIPAGNTTDCHCVTMPTQTVPSSGVITIPYAESPVQAAGKTVPELEKAIASALSKRAIEPQVIATINRKSSSQISVLGDVGAPQTMVLDDTGDRVLDAIARAGGVKSPPYEELVTVTRNGRSGTIYFNALVENPDQNIYLRPGDTVFVKNEKRTFTAFGSTGITDQFDFGAETLTLDEAVGKAGGLLDNRANPRQVFVYREEARSTLERQGVDLSRFPLGQEVIPTIYRANFTDPAGFFYAQHFRMRNGDVIYISNAQAVELSKFLNLLGLGSSVTNTTVNAARNARLLATGG